MIVLKRAKSLLFVLLFPLVIAASDFRYSYIPKKLYPNQIFPVTILENDADFKARPTFRFDHYGLQPIDLRPLIIRNGNDRFFTFYFKANDSDEVIIPALEIKSTNGTIRFARIPLTVSKLPIRNDFCGVLATKMKIKSAQTSFYDESRYLLTLSLEAYEANLEDMYLNGYEIQELENVRRTGAKVTGDFSVVAPSSQKRLQFSYFDTLQERFLTLSTPIEINNATVVTQTDLNPKVNTFDIFKKYLFIALAGFFFVMLLLTRDIFYAVLGAVSVIILLTFYTPRKRICIKAGTPLYILPTTTSDIGTRISKRITTPLLAKRNDYNKIEYKQGIVGWVKDEDLCQN